MDGASALPSGTAQPALPLAEALGRCNPDQRAPSPALAKEDVLYATRPKPPAQLIRATRSLEAAIAKLDKFHLLILDDIAYVTKDQAETSVLFELISARYERRSLLITANQPFGEWGKIFPDQAMTVAVVDRLVHHATIFEMNVESYRRRAALERKRGRGRPPIHATTAANT